MQEGCWQTFKTNDSTDRNSFGRILLHYVPLIKQKMLTTNVISKKYKSLYPILNQRVGYLIGLLFILVFLVLQLS